MSHRDIATGNIPISLDTKYSTSGPESSFGFKNVMPEDPAKVCYAYMALTTCTLEDMLNLAAGAAIVKDWVVVGYEGQDGIVS